MFLDKCFFFNLAIQECVKYWKVSEGRLKSSRYNIQLFKMQVLVSLLGFVYHGKVSAHFHTFTISSLSTCYYTDRLT